jgi:hypothetical protein
MRRTVTGIACVAAVFGGLAGTASASPPPPASCVGIITSAEASQLPPGSVGQEVSGLAQSVQPLAATLVSPLAREHGGNCG